MTTLGDSVTLECKVEAQPEPKMIFWRSHEDRTPVIQGGKYDITTKPVKDEEDKYIMQLTIKQITDMDVGMLFSKIIYLATCFTFGYLLTHSIQSYFNWCRIKIPFLEV